MSHLDKNKFDDSKQPTSKSIQSGSDPSSSATNQTIMNLANGTQMLSINEEQQINIDSSQLQIHTNPNAYNPKDFNTSPKAARFFVIKSYSEDDVHRSIKYNIWCSTEHGNRRLDTAYFKGDGQVPVYLFFSVNGSGHFCGMAEMQSRVDYNKKTDVWSQDKWRGCFQVKWIYVKDVPNSLLRNIKLENNDNKPVTNSRDTQEIPFDKGRQVLKVFHSYNHSSSILDDFDHYERKQEEDKSLVALNGYYEAPVSADMMTCNMSGVVAEDQIKPDKTSESSSSASSSSSSSIDESKLIDNQQQPQLIATSS